MSSLLIDRLSFQRTYATGRVINIGSSGNPAQLKAALHVDMDAGPFMEGPTPQPFLQCDARHIPQPDDSFDTAVMGEILEHFATEDLAIEALKEAHRLAANLVVTVPRDDRVLDPEHWAKETALREGTCHVCWISGDRLWRMLRASGWDVLLWVRINYGWGPVGWCVWAERAKPGLEESMEADYQARLKERFGTCE
jgi:hypothetical protein